MQEFGPAIDLCVGDRVMVDGYLPGVVKYVGDLDSNYTNSPTYVGVKLDDPGQQQLASQEILVVAIMLIACVAVDACS